MDKKWIWFLASFFLSYLVALHYNIYSLRLSINPNSTDLDQIGSNIHLVKDEIYPPGDIVYLTYLLSDWIKFSIGLRLQ